MMRLNAMHRSVWMWIWWASLAIGVYSPGVWAVESGGLFNSMVNMLWNLDRSVGNLHRLVVALSYVIGVLLLTSALFSLKHLADFRNMMSSNQQDFKKTFLKIVTGAALMWLPYTLEVMTTTLWGDSSPLGYTAAEPHHFTHVLYRLMKLVGIIALVRGLWLLSHGTEQGQSTTGRALTHIIGGALAYNASAAQSILQATLFGN